MRRYEFWITVGLLGAVPGMAVGGVLGRWMGAQAPGDHADRQTAKRTGAWAATVVIGAASFAIVGWFLGAWIGDVATRGCQEMDCLTSLLGPIGGDFIGAMIGAAVGVVVARPFRRAL